MPEENPTHTLQNCKESQYQIATADACFEVFFFCNPLRICRSLRILGRLLQRTAVSNDVREMYSGAETEGIMLQVKNIEKYYGSKNNVTKALDRVSFNVEDGEFIAIMGASGSGKTTLLNCISTIDTISAGSILLDGKEIAALAAAELAKFRRERLGFVFQDFNLLDTLTIEENIGLALSLNHIDPDEVLRRVQEAAGKLGIAEVLGKFPYQVSGGQKQRAACARAIVAGQTLLLADEPTGALDSKASKNLLELMMQMNGEMGTTILMVTHDAYSACYAKRVLFLKDGRLFNELLRGERTRSAFYHEILDVLALLGGDISDVI